MITRPLTEAQRARAELAATLDAIEDKFNLPKRAKRSARLFSRKVKTMRDENPLALVGIFVGAAVMLGGAVWIAVRALRK